MKIRRLALIAILLLSTGLGLIFGYCNGTTGLAAGDHISAWSIKLDVTTTGWPAILGVPLTLLGSLLLIVTAISTIVAEIRAALTKRKPAQPSEENATV